MIADTPREGLDKAGVGNGRTDHERDHGAAAIAASRGLRRGAPTVSAQRADDAHRGQLENDTFSERAPVLLTKTAYGAIDHVDNPACRDHRTADGVGRAAHSGVVSTTLEAPCRYRCARHDEGVDVSCVIDGESSHGFAALSPRGS